MAQLHSEASIDDLPIDDFPINDIASLRAAFDQLPERYQRVLSLRYLADLDPADVAEAMGLAKPALAVVSSRALKALRRELERAESGS